jgi:hypothetical protein
MSQITLSVDNRYVAILQGELRVGRDGRLADLEEIPEDVPDPDRARRQATLCDELLDQLANGSTLTGDKDELRDLLTVLYSGTDAAQQYEELAAEHNTFAHLLDQLDAT